MHTNIDSIVIRKVINIGAIPLELAVSNDEALKMGVTIVLFESPWTMLLLID